MDPYDWYAYRLKKAFKGWGTDDRTMCRILGCADKKDALKIAEAWQREPNPNPTRTRTRTLSLTLALALTLALTLKLALALALTRRGSASTASRCAR